MKNNRGFTLIEILSVIILITLLLGVGIPGINKISNSMKEKSLNAKIDLIEKAAVLWGQENKVLLQKETDCVYKDKNNNDITTSCYKISIGNLISEGFIPSEEYNEFINNCVYVYKKNNRVYAYYSKTNAGCDS